MNVSGQGLLCYPVSDIKMVSPLTTSLFYSRYFDTNANFPVHILSILLPKPLYDGLF